MIRNHMLLKMLMHVFVIVSLLFIKQKTRIKL